MNIHEANDTITEYFTLVNRVSSEDTPIEDSIDIMERIDGMRDCINEALAVIGKFIHTKAGPNQTKRKPISSKTGGTDEKQYRGYLIEVHTNLVDYRDSFYGTMDEHVEKDHAKRLTDQGINAIRYRGEFYKLGDIFTSKNTGNTGPIHEFSIDNSMAGNARRIRSELGLSERACIPVVKFGHDCSTPMYNTNKK